MENQDNHDDAEERDRSNWTIKNVEVEVRKLALAQATKAGVAMHEWLARAVRNQAKLEAGDHIIPPDRVSWPNGQPNGEPGQHALPTSISELVEMMNATLALSQAGSPLGSVASDARAVLRKWLRQAGELPPLPPPKRKPPAIKNEMIEDVFAGDGTIQDGLAGAPMNERNEQTAA
jgi:hypothetical protein